jgi:hypothetical protein
VAFLQFGLDLPGRIPTPLGRFAFNEQSQATLMRLPTTSPSPFLGEEYREQRRIPTSLTAEVLAIKCTASAASVFSLRLDIRRAHEDPAPEAKKYRCNRTLDET